MLKSLRASGRDLPPPHLTPTASARSPGSQTARPSAGSCQKNQNPITWWQTHLCSSCSCSLQVPVPVRAQIDKNSVVFLPAFTLLTTLGMQEESGTIQPIYKTLMAALNRSRFDSRTLPAGRHGASNHAPRALLLPGHSHVVHICPRSLFQHLI